MGSHADPHTSSFYRSLGRAVLRAGLVIVVLLVIVGGVAWYSLSRTDPDRSVVLADTADRTPTTNAPTTTTPVTRAPASATTAERAPVKTAKPTPSQEESQGRDTAPPAVQAPANTSVQVLDGVGNPALTEQAVVHLRGLGYQVVAVNPMARDFAQTTVLYSDGYQAEARALQARDDRFSRIGKNQALSKQVHLHIIVGADWSAQAG